ncbi:MAG: PH domain-containing protein [Phycisphaerae bacterium]
MNTDDTPRRAAEPERTDSAKSDQPAESRGQAAASVGRAQDARSDHAGAVLADGGIGDGDVLDPQAETAIWTGRTNWRHFIGRLLLWAAGNVGGALVIFNIVGRIDGWGTWQALGGTAGLMLVSALVVLGPIAITILGRRYRLTSQRLFIERGLLSQTIDQTELIRVDDVRIRKTFLDRLMGLGSVAILSTDATDREIVIEGIAGPESVAEAIRTRMRTMRRKSLFVENL